MALSLASSSSHCSCSFASQLLPSPKPKTPSFFVATPPSSSPILLPPPLRLRPRRPICAASKSNPSVSAKTQKNEDKSKINEAKEEGEFEEVEEELPWIQDKALDVVEFTGSVTQAIPGPRVGSSSLPWILALPLGYAGITFVIAFVKTVRKFTSPRAKRKKLVNKNATLLKSIDELFQKGRDEVTPDALKHFAQKTDFGTDEILRKYIRYTLNEKPFNPDVVADLIQLRKASGLDDSQVAEVLNEISRRTVQDKGPVVMDLSGYTEKGFKRKLAVQALFGKLFYLAELPEFCSKDSSLVIKEIFGVADEDADQLRMHTLSEAGDVDLLEKMVDDDSDSEESIEDRSQDH
ncbi:ribosomal RNA small subunit methyltransferase J [Trema orientale]|uniref:Ribosomal RNA small subunit methyltransferase J n=1 Tax=Trema orientale TaxID=63057 RepID=A0A2P5EQC4_TREOI|nr:ribosomal RNA small subunit methyltransferase J [Trema orientale]